MELQIKERNGFNYVDEGTGEVLLLLHGLFGALSNWEDVVREFSTDHRVIIPLLPIYEMPLSKAGVPGLMSYVEDFLAAIHLTEPTTVLGNSLGGHVALVYTLRHPDRVRRLVLTGSSGLFEDSMGGSFPKRGNYAFVQERVAYTFYDPQVATKELVDEVFNVTNSNAKCLRIISIARSAQRHNLGKDLTRIKVPTLLVWGLNDTITPPPVAHEFHRLISSSELRFLDHCGHAPMMERPQEFNAYLRQFLRRTAGHPVAVGA
ncbi:Pimeloyl-ACP methyl ester carboxylesterase [Hymenobacter daecheongensis DSM 21074]|uniref:Pimeloyl-ACP methyl ester carboxylesterase n=1 Tax=Hymenobacter daecheongensis DSM 21074 TaxID=1121955 RepID=A0A1M6A4V8_9BACT|nr:alpha/beta hydrolase [Hymenobacter daecheongensis]SHI31477.1 Pimeloyl-ACP methyl ester carboxylesterase [Hymenobacter daecheongensis DSM 21074]